MDPKSVRLRRSDRVWQELRHGKWNGPRSMEGSNCSIDCGSKPSASEDHYRTASGSDRVPRSPHPTLGPATLAAIDAPRYGTPTLVAPRLGQGSFRALVTDVYRYRCAISNERTLPVLQAAHIRPYADGGQHELSNGLLLRSDLHTLFDQHYLTVDPNKKTLIVSRRIREQFENGCDYYALDKRSFSTP